MVDGFHWTRVTSKQLRFLYEAVTFQPAPPHMYELAAKIDGSATAQTGPQLQHSSPCAGVAAAPSIADPKRP
jgi:hypothetical protein